MKKWNKVIVVLLTLFVSLQSTCAYFHSSSKVPNEIKTQKYSFNLNGSDGIYSQSDISVLKNKTILPSPTKTGYSFLGYSDSQNGSVKFSNQISDVSVINNKSIYAKWQVNRYSISYNLNGGSLSNPKSSYTIEDNFNLPIPTKTGYSFLGWTGSGVTNPIYNLNIKNSTGNKNYTANWSINKYSVDINSIVQNTTYNSGLDGFTFSVWLNGSLVADHVKDYSNSAINYGTKVRVYVYDRTGYNVKSFRDQTWTVTSNLTINPKWYDDIPPTITSFSVTNLGKHDSGVGYNVKIYINGYDNGVGIEKYQAWLMPTTGGAGSARKDGQETIYKNVVKMNTSTGRTFCAYAVDKAGNESERCETLKI